MEMEERKRRADAEARGVAYSPPPKKPQKAYSCKRCGEAMAKGKYIAGV